MARMTRKRIAAETTASLIGVSIRGDLYQSLADEGYHWNSETGEWENWNETPADEPTELIRIRAWARGEAVEMVADGVVESMLAAGLRLIERSRPYPCRPPKQAESRVYLTFEAR